MSPATSIVNNASVLARRLANVLSGDRENRYGLVARTSSVVTGRS